MLHGPGHSMEECKVLKEYSTKYTAQRPNNEREARSGSNKKCGKIVKFDRTTEEMNLMTAHDAPIPRKIWGGDKSEKPNSNKDMAVP